MRQSTFVFLVISTIAGWSCKGDGDNPPVDPTDPSTLTLENYPEALSAVVCKRVFNCPFATSPFDASLSSVRRQFQSEELCRSYFDREFREDNETRESYALVQAEVLSFDRGKAAACLDVVQSCNTVVDSDVERCPEMYVRAKNASDTFCRTNHECPGGGANYCMLSSGCGVCMPREAAGRGESCEGRPCRSASLLENLFCEPASMTCQPVPNVLGKAAGEACGICDAQSWCHVSEMGQPGICRPSSKDGEPCAEGTCGNSQICEESDVCDFGLQCMDGICQSNPPAENVGDACEFEEDASKSCSFENRLVCNGDSCVTHPIRAGENCTTDLDACASGLVCALSPGRRQCVALGTMGQSCTRTDQCEWPLICNLMPNAGGTCGGYVDTCSR